MYHWSSGTNGFEKISPQEYFLGVEQGAIDLEEIDLDDEEVLHKCILSLQYKLRDLKQ